MNFLKKPFFYSLKLLFFILSPLFFFLIKIIKPFITIRFIPVMSNRYGHLSLNLEFYLVEKKEKKRKKKYLDFFFTSRYGICNYELLNLYKKQIIIYPHYLLEPIHILFEKIYKKNEHTIPFFSRKVRDIDCYFQKHKSSIQLTSQQNNYCENILKDYGIDLNSNRLVCLFNRDDTYLESFNKSKYNRSWYYVSHHKYNVNKFLLAAEKLAERNIYLFRMGSGAEKNFNTKNDKFIDYANSKIRSELMDIYLASKCIFGMGGGTGAKGVALVFRKPLLHLNADVHELMTYLKDSVLLSKSYYSESKKRNLTLKEILNYKHGELSHRENIDLKGIKMIDSSEQEITDAVLEMLNRIDGNWEDTEEIIQLQNVFKNHNWKNLRYKDTGQRLHGDIFNANYSSKFLLENKNWLGL